MQRIWLLLCLLILITAGKAHAQTYRTDGGAVITDRSLLLSSDLRVVYLSLVEVNSPCWLEQTITSSEGVVYKNEVSLLHTGIKRGERVILWSGGTEKLLETYWLYFQIVLRCAEANYYAGTQLPIGKPELGRELFISGVTERFPSQRSAVMQIHGSFDTYEPAIVILNDDYRVPNKLIRILSTTLVEIDTRKIPAEYLPKGKFLVTVCQTSWCDSIQGKHR